MLRAVACKYGESDERSENSDFLLFRQKDLFGELFSELDFQSASEFTFLSNQESSKYRSINRIMQNCTERSELAWISYSYSL